MILYKEIIHIFRLQLSIFVQSHGFINSKLGSVLLVLHIISFINSDFDAHHDSPKEEVNQDDFINRNDVSDIFKDIVDDKGDSSCLKSLRKTRLSKIPCTY